MEWLSADERKGRRRVAMGKVGEPVRGVKVEIWLKMDWFYGDDAL